MPFTDWLVMLWLVARLSMFYVIVWLCMR